MNILVKRPIITIFIFYASFLIVLNCLNFFSPQRLSLFFHFAKYNKPVSIEGKVISDIEIVNNNKRFILKASQINGLKVNEKTLVLAQKGYDISYGDEIALVGYVNLPNAAPFPLLFDYQKYLSRENIYTIFRADSFEFIKSSPNAIMKAALFIRNDIVKTIDQYFNSIYGAILKPLIIGDKSSIQKEIREAFVDAGLMHILVVSGLNVGFVGGLFLIIFKALGFPLRKVFLLTIPMIFLYVLITGANPPVLRAGIMFSAVLLSLTLDREPLIYNSLALSALLILIFSPQQIFTASFQMSYLATIGIIYFYPKISGLFKNIKKPYIKAPLSVFCVTAGAQIFMYPISAYYFGKVSAISLLSNMLVVPLIGIITTLGFVFYFASFISSFLAMLLSYCLSLMLAVILFLVNFLGTMYYASIAIAKPRLWQLFLFFFFVFAITGLKGKKRWIISALILIIGISYYFITKIIDNRQTNKTLYENRNMTILHEKTNGKNSFIIAQKQGGYYDKYYIYNFKQYLSYAGLKNSRIAAADIKDEKQFQEDFKDYSVK
ncbi:MAG: ComEC family competence protein [Elusimicrobiota bacterium]|jgi:competence protein ComEC|nr:ComEC family competence protein [Elusimicrobiota bacterium]